MPKPYPKEFREAPPPASCLVGPAPCLNMVVATRDGHVLHQFPCAEEPLARSPEGWASVEPDWKPAPPAQPGGELVPPIQAAVNFAFTPIVLNHPDPFGATVVRMEEDGYSVGLMLKGFQPLYTRVRVEGPDSMIEPTYRMENALHSDTVTSSVHGQATSHAGWSDQTYRYDAVGRC